MHDLYIADIYRHGPVFAGDTMALLSFSSTQRTLEKEVYCKVHYGHSRSSKLVLVESSFMQLPISLTL